MTAICNHLNHCGPSTVLTFGQSAIMKDIDDVNIKSEINEIANKIDSIIQKVNELEPQKDEDSHNERGDETP